MEVYYYSENIYFFRKTNPHFTEIILCSLCVHIHVLTFDISSRLHDLYGAHIIDSLYNLHCQVIVPVEQNRTTQNRSHTHEIEKYK